MGMTRLADLEFHRILLVKPSSLGDIVHALPVLRGLRRRYPCAHIAWLAAAPFVDLLESHPDVSEVIRFDRYRYGKMLTSLSALTDFIGFMRDLRRRKFDLVIDLQGLFRSGFLAWATGAPVRIGFSNAREIAPVFYSHRIRVADMDTHAVDRNYLVSSLLGFSHIPIGFEVPTADSARRSARGLLRGRLRSPAGQYAAVLPGTRWETKHWYAAPYARIIDWLDRKWNLPTVLMGAAADRPLCEEIERQCTRPVVNLAGLTTLSDTVALIEEAALVLGQDSAPMHLAAALDRPLVALFGPTSSTRTGPYGKLSAVVRLDLSCSPCYFRKLAQCPHSHRCMSELSANQVQQAIDAMLRATRPLAAEGQAKTLV